jgi:phosphatidate cytidylyltransferase
MNEFIKRFLTAIVVSLIALFFITIGGYFFILFLLILFLLSFFEWFKLCKNKTILIFGTLVLSLSFLSAFILRYEDLPFFILVILISITSDIGGYIFGKFFKGPKLTKISPKKTYSGMIGSYFMSILVGIFYINYLNTNSIYLELKFSSIIILIIIFFISTINQLGDLTISYFKRLKKVDDTGKFLPGHGGILDRIDGLIFSMLVGFLFRLFLL